MSINDEIKQLNQQYDTPPPSDETLIENLRLNAATRSDIQIAANWSKMVAYVMIGACGLMVLFLAGMVLLGITRGGLQSESISSIALGLLVVVGVLGAGIYLGTLLLNYSKTLAALTTNERPYGLAHFFQQQNRYWVMFGVYTIVAIAFYIIVLILIIPISQGQSF